MLNLYQSIDRLLGGVIALGEVTDREMCAFLWVGSRVSFVCISACLDKESFECIALYLGMLEEERWRKHALTLRQSIERLLGGNIALGEVTETRAFVWVSFVACICIVAYLDYESVK